jgi:HEAT repeat protein
MASVAFRLGVAGLMLCLSQGIRADDAHDKLVYGRYSRKVEPTTTKAKWNDRHDELNHPAAKEDVQAGKAVFTFEGLGEARVWKLPERSVMALWPALEPRLFGIVCQAEELQVNGKWKRYFGFLCEQGAAVVPANEIDFLSEVFPNTPYFAGLRWFLAAPARGLEYWKNQEATPNVDDPLPIVLYVQKHDRDERDGQEIALNWYRDARSGGPALREGVGVSLTRAPFDPRTVDRYYPQKVDFKTVAPIRNAHFPPDGAKRVQKRGEPFRAVVVLDLRDWFKVEQEGYYEVRVDIDGESLRLADDQRKGASFSRRFVIGHEPKRLTIEDVNKELPVLGGEENQRRLRRVIKETIAPKPVQGKAPPAELEKLLAWSEPVGGLAARIEYGFEFWGPSVFVRIKNVSDKPLAVPTGNPRDKKAPRNFELYVRQGDGPWRDAGPGWDRYCEEPSPSEDPKYAYKSGGIAGKETDRPTVALQPGEHCLAYVNGDDKEDNGQTKTVKVVLRRPEGAAGDWAGALETPPRALRITDAQCKALEGALTMPEHFPKFTYTFLGINWSGEESVIMALSHSNWGLLDLLPMYNPAGIRKEMEVRMRAEKRWPVKLFLAVVAARAGSEDAALFLLETMKDSDYRVRVNLHSALDHLFPWPPAPPPAWVVELALTALADHRYATGTEETHWGSETQVVLSEMARGLAAKLGEAKCREAVPALIEMANRPGGDWAVATLGEIGDPRAVPCLIELAKKANGGPAALALAHMGDKRAVPCLIELAKKANGGPAALALAHMGDKRAVPYLMRALEAAAKHVKYSKIEERLSEDFAGPMHALAEIKAPEAVPVLLRFLEFPPVIYSLETFGDPRVVPALEGLVAAGGKITREGKDVYPELQQKRLFVARVTLAAFDADKGIARLGQMLGDQSLSVHERYDAVMCLSRRHDPKAIPYLLKLIKTECCYKAAGWNDSRHYILDMAIGDLGEMKYKAAVEGLIDCFDLQFQEEKLHKGRRATPATYRLCIVRSLQRITGQPFGDDKQQWRRWWEEQGKASKELK